MVLNSNATKYYFLVAKIYGLDVASFSGLPRFYLPFAFTQYTGTVDRQKTGKAWKHSSCEWMQSGRRGGGADIQICMYYLKAIFLMVKKSIFNCTNVWS